MFPSLSAPLVKDIRTGEGIAEWALGTAVAVLTAVGDLGVVKGATLLTILTALKGIRRGVIKAVGVGARHFGPPIQPLTIRRLTDTLSTDVAGVADAAAKENS